jgi:hypothetical protein
MPINRLPLFVGHRFFDGKSRTIGGQNITLNVISHLYAQRGGGSSEMQAFAGKHRKMAICLLRTIATGAIAQFRMAAQSSIVDRSLVLAHRSLSTGL